QTVADWLATILKTGRLENFPWIEQPGGVSRAQDWFSHYYLEAAMWCAAGVAGWLILWAQPSWWRRLLPALGVLLVADLLRFAYGRNPQCDWELYYPRIPVLEAVAKSTPGRCIGYACLAPNLEAMCGLRDVRGYDGVDPARFTELMAFHRDPRSRAYGYTSTQFLIPEVKLTPQGDAELSPILDMLGVRYVIFRGSPGTNAHAAFQGPDYWALINPKALPMVYIPKRVEVVDDSVTRLE